MGQPLMNSPDTAPVPHAQAQATAGERLEGDELLILSECVPLGAQRIIELGCGNARMARTLLTRHPACRVTALEVDAVQHARNLAEPAERLDFLAAGAQAIPLPDAQFDLALMLKSLHHVPLDALDAALAETRRVLRPGGHLYVSEPVYDGALNEVVRLFNDEREVHAAAQAALDRAVSAGGWREERTLRFAAPVHYRDFDDFARRMFDVTFVERRISPAQLAQIHARFQSHLGADGAHFTRPMLVRLLRRA